MLRSTFAGFGWVLLRIPVGADAFQHSQIGIVGGTSGLIRFTLPPTFLVGQIEAVSMLPRSTMAMSIAQRPKKLAIAGQVGLLNVSDDRCRAVVETCMAPHTDDGVARDGERAGEQHGKCLQRATSRSVSKSRGAR